MGMLRFGRHETLECIVDIDVRGPQAEELCLAYKTTSYWFGAGVYLSDDGYVAKPRAATDTYFPLTPDELAAEGMPHPLPAYSIPVLEYALGYSLWILLPVMAVWGAAQHQLKKRRRAAFDATLRDLPLDLGPPRIVTEADRFVAAETTKLLAPGEHVMHQAYALAWDSNLETPSVHDAFFLALTSARRLIVLHTRVGALKILLQNDGVLDLPRSAIQEAHVDDGVFFLTTTDGAQHGYFVKTTSKLSNQEAFLHHAARILSQPA